MATELCKKCGFEIEAGAPCPFCPPVDEPVKEQQEAADPPVVEDVKPASPAPEPAAAPKTPISNEEKLARIEQAYLDGKMTRAQYEKNKAKFAKAPKTSPSEEALLEEMKAIGLPKFSVGIKGDIENDPNPDNECLSCGHVIGSKDKCPRCAAGQKNRLSEKKIIAISMVLLLIGAAYLGAAGVYSETKITKVDEILESDNFRNIRVIGKVVDLPSFYPEKYDPAGVMRLLVDDGTGEIWVRIISSITEVLKNENRIPGFGDTVDAEGSLFVGDEGYMQIKVRDKNLFQIQERNYTKLAIADLIPSDKADYEVGQQVSLTGKIVDKFYIDGFAWIFDLADDFGNSISVFMPESITQLTGDLDVSAMFLSEVNVEGALEWYDGGNEWELIPTTTDSINIVTPYTGDTYLVMSVGEMLANASALSGLYVQVENVTVEWRYEDFLFSVSDSSTTEELSIFVDYNANASINIKEGDTMSVRGWVTYYDSNANGVPDFDEWELKIREASSDYALDQEDMWGGS